MFAAMLGSLPGEDFRGATRWVLDTLGPQATLPQLPTRGAASGMLGQAVGLLDGLGADLQRSGWRLLPGGGGADQRRARAQWRRDLDDLEELAQGYDGSLTIPVCGPWTLAASVSRPLGDLVLADHGARRELSESLASGYADAVAEISRRLPSLSVRAQVDEPLLPAVLSGAVPTASGFSKHRRVDAPDAVAGLARLVDAVTPATHSGTHPVLHCCAPGLDLDIVRKAGFTGVAVDARLVSAAQWDALSGWLEEDRSLWLGVVATDVPDATPAVDDVVRTAVARLRPLGLDPALMEQRVALTPACGLAGWSPAAARRALEALVQACPLVAEQLAR